MTSGVKIIGGFSGAETAASQSNPAMNQTILDGAGTKQCITHTNPDPGQPAPVLRGFTLRNGRDTDDEGGAMLLENSDAHIVQCIFEENSATHFGGAVSIRGVGSPRFVNCIFRKNGTSAANPRDTKGGGAVYVRDGTPFFVNCLFHNNQAGDGGALITREGLPTLMNCTLADNRAVFGRGAAIFDQEGRVTIENCIVWNNTRDPDGPNGPKPVVVDPDQIFGGSGGRSIASYSDIQGGWEGANLLNVDPLFVDSAAANYALQITSPCKNAGLTVPIDTVDLDWDTNTNEPLPKDLGLLPRVRLGAIDLGVFEIFSDSPPGGGEG